MLAGMQKFGKLCGSPIGDFAAHDGDQHIRALRKLLRSLQEAYAAFTQPNFFFPCAADMNVRVVTENFCVVCAGQAGCKTAADLAQPDDSDDQLSIRSLSPRARNGFPD